MRQKQTKLAVIAGLTAALLGPVPVAFIATSHAKRRALPPKPAVYQYGTIEMRLDIIDLGTLGGELTTAASINDFGQVVGLSKDSNGRYRAYKWKDRVMRSLGASDAVSSDAMRIGPTGDVVGMLRYGNSLAPTSAVYVHGDKLTKLLPLAGDASSEANAINSHGDVTGCSGSDRCSAVIRRHGSSSPQPITSRSVAGTALSINDNGTIAGTKSGFGTVAHAYIVRGGVLADKSDKARVVVEVGS